LKIAVAGKGGVGKTLISGTLARLLARDGFRVLAVDADPAMNLAYALGIPPNVASKIVPISENKELIEERIGAKPGSASRRPWTTLLIDTASSDLMELGCSLWELCVQAALVVCAQQTH